MNFARRERPPDGGMVWHERIHAFECLGCGEYEEMRSRRRYEDAELVALMKEPLALDHAECWEYCDARMARQARRYRKERKRRELLAGTACGVRG